MAYKLSIVIIAWNSEEFIDECLSSIGNLEYEIIVVDNDSKDNTVKIIEEQFPHVKLIKNSYNSGYTHATNQGIRVASAPFILLLNPDTIVLDNALDKMLQFMQSKLDIGALGPQLLNPDRSIQPSCREFPTFRNLFPEIIGIARIRKRSSRWKMGYFDHNSLLEVDQPMGSALLIRKEVFEKIGLLDERYFNFMSDVDICHRIKQAGYKIYFLPDAQVMHSLGGATRKVKKKMILEEHWALYRYLKYNFTNRWLISLYACLLLGGAFYRILFYYILKPFRK
jgi:GT2 family glycosyltransferase